MSAALPNMYRLELRLPSSVAVDVVIVEVHLLQELDTDQSFVQPAATTAANGVNSSVGSAVYTPVTNARQLMPLFPANNVALNYSATASVGQTILAALFSASPSTSVQLNYVMRQQPDSGHYSVDYVALQPQLNQSLWYYFTVHTAVSGLDTNWQHVTVADALADDPTNPPSDLADPDIAQLLDVSSPAGTVVDEGAFVWKTAVLTSTSTSSAAAPPPAPGASPSDGAVPAAQYRIALVTNSSALLWANVAWQRNGDAVVRSSMDRLSATQFLSAPIAMQPGDALTYTLSWWDLASNAEQSSPLTFLYRPATAEAQQLTATAASGASTLPGGTNLGDGQSVWTKLQQSVQASLSPLPTLPASPNLGLGLSSPASSSTSGSVVGAVSSGLASLLSTLSALQTGPAQVVSSAGQSAVSVNELPASSTIVAPTNSSSAVSTQSLADLITPLALIGSLAGLTSPSSSSQSLSSFSAYASAALCVLPCATSSQNSDVMVSCLGGCASPFLPAGLSSSEATSVINALHDYVVSNAQQAGVTTPSSTVALNQTTASNSTLVSQAGGNASSSTSGQDVDNSSTLTNTSTTAPAQAVTPVSVVSSDSGQSTSSALARPAAAPSGAIFPQTAASSILQWLTGTGQSTATASPLSSIPSLLQPAGASAPAGPGAALASSLSSGLGYLSTPLLAGLASLSSGQVSITSNPAPATGGLTLTSFGQSVTLPLSLLSALLTPLMPPGTSASTVATTATYVAGLTCMLPCVGGGSVTSTSQCIGGCIDAVVPGGAGAGGAKLVHDIDSIIQPVAQGAAMLAPATLLSSSSSSSSTGSARAPSSAAAAGSSASAASSSTAASNTLPVASPASTASPTLSLTGLASAASTAGSVAQLSSSAAQVVAQETGV